MRQVSTELLRFRSRRLIGLLLLAAVLLTAVVAFRSAWETRPPSKAELSTARAKASIEGDRTDIQADLHKCLRKPTEYLGKDATEADCRKELLPSVGGFLPRPTLDLAGTLEGNGAGVAALLIALMVVAASTFAGSDWATGSMTTQLLAEPRRVRLWWAKAGAVAIAAAAVTLVCLAAFWTVLVVVANARDGAPNGAVVGDIVEQVLRAVVLAAAAAIGSFALTAAFRNTLATLSICFTFACVGELLVALPLATSARWSLGNNVFGWLRKHATLKGGAGGSLHLEHWQAGLYLFVVLLVAIAVGLDRFRRADA